MRQNDSVSFLLELLHFISPHMFNVALMTAVK